MELKLQSYNKMHIDIYVINLESGEELWRFTGFYRESKRELRYKSWDRLQLLKSKSSLPWLCASDFNEVLDPSEHFGVQ